MTSELLTDRADPVALALVETPPPSEPSGSVVTSIESGQAVVWLRGEIDLALAVDLAGVAAQVSDLGRDLVLEASRMTFCDSTLVNFIGTVSRQVAVTVNRPPHLLIDLLEICGLSDCVQVSLAGAAAPGLPA